MLVQAIGAASCFGMKSSPLAPHLQPTIGAIYDELFGHASSLGLKVIAEIQGNPSWAAEFPGGPPHDYDTLAQFMAAAVERYDGDGIDDAPGNIQIQHWELYNEPDNFDARLAVEGRGWGYWGHNGAAYAQMLKRV